MPRCTGIHAQIRLERAPRSNGIRTYDTWLRSIHPDDRERCARKVQSVSTAGTYRDAFRLLHQDGTVRWVESDGEILFDSEGRPSRMLGTVRDVTERHEAEESIHAALTAAKQQVIAREQLVSLVSHDLRNPLGVLKLAVLLLRNLVAPEKQAPDLTTLRDLAERMIRQTSRMEQIIDELLDLAYLHAGRPLELRRCDVDLVPLVRSELEEHQQGARRHRLSMHVECEPLVVSCDATRVRRAVANLISNAIKYSPHGGDVYVTIGYRADVGKRAMIKMRDEGIGIPASDQGRIFSWLQRGQNVGEDIRGTGIGLAGVKQVVDEHGGRVFVESVEGQGSIFTMELPAEARRVAAAPPDELNF